MLLRHLPLYLISIFSILLSSRLSWAQTKIEFSSQTPVFRSQQISAGPISVSVSYKTSDDSNLDYQISYQDNLKLENSTKSFYRGSVALQDLDGNRIAEVIVETFSGGAHCCTNFTIYSWVNNEFRIAEIGEIDGRGGSFQDLDGDGRLEFASVDNAFLSAFSSYAGSYPPSQILALQNGQLKDVTRHYPQFLRSRLWRMYQNFQERQQNGFDMNGLLAGYVAQKILVGEFEQGWQFMLAHYDRTSNEGLIIFRDGREVGRYRDFPTALKAFLIKHGYLDGNGRPL